MADAKFTPGPWQAEWPDCGEYRYVSSTVTTMCPETAVCRLNQSQEADARLIAAAPELLEALREAEGELYQVPPADAEQERVLAVVRAAIAKAGGAR